MSGSAPAVLKVSEVKLHGPVYLLAKGDVVIDRIEHDGFSWVDYDIAIEMIYWDSTRRALAAVADLSR